MGNGRSKEDRIKGSKIRGERTHALFSPLTLHNNKKEVIHNSTEGGKLPVGRCIQYREGGKEG